MENNLITINKILNKKILIWGYGLEGKSVVNLLLSKGVKNITVATKDKIEDTKENVSFILEDDILKYDFDYIKGATWTTDAFYRETREKIQMYKSKGAICVEMEGASIGAVCEYKKLNYFTFYYAGDNLDSVEWEERSLRQLSSFDKKVKVPMLALELANRIENN